MTKLTLEDAYAFRRIFAKMDIPEGLALSPMARMMIDSLDPVNNQAGWQTLYDMVANNQAIMQQVLYVDPTTSPPIDDHAYVDQYIQQVTTQSYIGAPDTNRTNGSTELLARLYEAHQQTGPQAARQILDAQRSPLCSVQDILHRPPVDYLDDENIIQKEEITAVVGQPGAGKSFWALAKLTDMAQTMPVLYIAGEGINPDRLHALMQMRESAGKANDAAFYDNFKVYDQPLNLTSELAVEQFVDQLGDFKPQVIAIDTFAACTPDIEENSSKDVQPVMNRIREMLIKRLGCAVLLIHHTTKDGKSFRGSSALRGNVANMYYLTKDDEYITLRSDKQRDSEPSPKRHYRLITCETRLHPKTKKQISSAVMVPVEKVINNLEEDQPQLTYNQQNILEVLEPFETGMTGRSLEDATGIAKSTLWRNIGKLVKYGYVKTGEKGEPIYITEAGRGLLFNQ